jgi:hypothetical protein
LTDWLSTEPALAKESRCDLSRQSSCKRS